jgi:2-alkyl-3-oxoalkanoate reductase
MQILITGATGVLGRPAVRALVGAGHAVRALARSDANVTLLRSLGAEPLRADLFDAAAMRDAAAGCQAILHLATKIPPATRLGRRSAWAETDRIRRDGTRIVVDAALAQGAGSLIYQSICFAYPESGAEWIDACNREPVIGDYYRTTFDAEAEVRRFTTGAGGRGVVLRLGFLYGPESSQSHVQLAYARWGIASVPGRPDAYHPFVAIEDAARAIVAATTESVPAGVYDIAENEPPTTAEITAAMAAAVGRRRLIALPPPVVRMTIGGEIAGVMSRSQRVSNRRFGEATGWQPRVATGDGWGLVAGGAKATTT